MSDEIKQAVEQVNGLVTQLRTEFETFQKRKHLTPEEFKAFQDKISEDILTLQTKLDRPPAAPAKETKDEPSLERKAFQKFLKHGPVNLTPDEVKVLQISDQTLGGYLAPTEFVRELLKDIVEFSPVRQLARTRQTTATAVEIPKKTGAATAAWVTELGSKSETTGLTFGMEKLEPFEMYSLYKFTKKSLEDTAFNLEEEARLDAAEQQGLLEGTAFISGSGSNQPEGILTNAAVLAAKVAGNNSGAIGVNDLMDTKYALPAAYDRQGTWLMRRASEKACMLLTDGASRYIWMPSLAVGQPATLLGAPIVSCPDMPAIAANAYAVAYGDFRRGYLIVDRLQVEVQRLVELYAEAGQIGLMIRRRVTGQVVMANAIRVLQIKA